MALRFLEEKKLLTNKGCNDYDTDILYLNVLSIITLENYLPLWRTIVDWIVILFIIVPAVSCIAPLGLIPKFRYAINRWLDIPND